MALGFWQKLADNGDPASWASRLRRRRLARFSAFVASLPRPVRVLDVGGTPSFWMASGLRGGDLHVTLLNLTATAEQGPYREVSGDARALPFANDTFDVVFSNSMIEHVGPASDQLRAAREMQRVAPRWFVQTPNYYFPIEPHFLVPGFQFLPIALRAHLLTKTRLGWHGRERDPERARQVVEGVRLLTRRDLGRLFPGSTIEEERVVGLVKSLMVIGSRRRPLSAAPPHP